MTSTVATEPPPAAPPTDRSGGGPAAAARSRGVTTPRVALALVLAVSLVARLWGLDWQLPWQFHPDEGHYTWKALDLIGEQTLNPRYFRNPSLFTYLLYVQYRLLGFAPPKSDDQASTATGLFRPPSGVAYVGRLNSAAMGTANAAAVAWIGWRLLGPWAGVTAAAFLGLAFVHVRDSHYATNDVPSTLLLTLSVGCALEASRRPGLARFALAGLLGGLATSAKYNAGLFLVPLAVACATRESPPRSARAVLAHLGRGMPLLFLALGIAGLAYLAGTPYTAITFDRFWADFRTQMRLGGEGWEGQVPGPTGPLYLAALAQGVGLPMLAMAAIGLVLLARHRPRDAAILASFPLAYALYMLRTELFFVRFALPLVPFVCLLASCGVILVVRLLPRRAASAACGSALAVGVLVLPTANVVLHNRLVEQEDTRVLAARWALASIPPDVKVWVEEYTIRDRRPRSYGGPAWQLDTDLIDVNDLPASDPAAGLRDRRRFVIVSSFQYERFAGDAPKLARQTAFYRALEREGRLVAEFGPGPGGAPVPFDLEDLYTPFWSLERYERPGPTIKIYEILPP